MYFLFVFLPFFSFLFSALFSKFFGHKGTAYLTTFFLAFNAILSIFIFYEVVLCDSFCYFILFDWFNIGLLKISWSCYFDSLTALMSVMVTIVSFSVHFFSVNYMSLDFQHERFMSLLSLFTFFMLILIVSDNFLQLLLGWEGVGICSYLLINFWFMRKNTNDSALKAVFFNRVGDFFLLLGIFSIFYSLNTLDFFLVFDNFYLLQNVYFDFIFFQVNLLNLVCFFLTIGAMAKSAQVFLQGWLGDAMEGPTPVSALIHAATMVTAGIYLLARCSFLFVNARIILFFIVLVGSLTTFLCSLIGVDTNDLKKIIASSTASQLGYMFYTCGLAEFSFSISHLFFHAFFKALLFLSAGSVIHTLSDEQDIRKMGGLVVKFPLIFISMSIGSYALIGFPFLGGFYTKDPLIEYSDSLLFLEELMSLFCCTLGAFNTAFYSTRLLYLVFLGEYKGQKINYSFLHPSSIFILLPLILLIFFTMLSFLFVDLFLGEGQNVLVFFGYDLFLFREGEEDSDIFLFLLFFIFLGIFSFINENFIDFSFFYFEVNNFIIDLDLFDILKSFNYFKWFTDLFFIKTLMSLFSNFADFLFLSFDRGIFEIYGPSFLFIYFKFLSNFFSFLQSGFIYHYIFFQIVFIFMYILIFFFNYFFTNFFFFEFFLTQLFLIIYIYTIIGLNEKKL